MQKNVPKYTPDGAHGDGVGGDVERKVSTRSATTIRTLMWFADQRRSSTTRRSFASSTPTGRRISFSTSTRPRVPRSAAVVRVVHLVRQALRDAGLEGAVKTSGAKGVHVFVPVDGNARRTMGGGDPCRSWPAGRGWIPTSRRWRSCARTGAARSSSMQRASVARPSRRVQPACVARCAGLVSGGRTSSTVVPTTSRCTPRSNSSMAATRGRTRCRCRSRSPPTSSRKAPNPSRSCAGDARRQAPQARPATKNIEPA